MITHPALPESLVDKSNDCWLWRGSCDKNGYGLLRIAGVTTRVNRLAWKDYFGEIPEGKHVLHTCDQPSCVRKEHLFLGSHQDNMTDMVNKGRSYRPAGALNPKAKLTQAKADEMRALFAAGTLGKGQLQVRYGVSRITVERVLARQVW